MEEIRDEDELALLKIRVFLKEIAYHHIKIERVSVILPALFVQYLKGIS